MATRSLNRILVVSRTVLWVILAITVVLAIAALLLLNAEADQPTAQVRIPAPTHLVFTETHSTTDGGEIHFIEVAHPVWELSATYRTPDEATWRASPTAAFEQPEADPLPSLVVAAALLSVGALLGALIQYSVVWAAERRASERVFP